MTPLYQKAVPVRLVDGKAASLLRCDGPVLESIFKKYRCIGTKSTEYDTRTTNKYRYIGSRPTHNTQHQSQITEEVVGYLYYLHFSSLLTFADRDSIPLQAFVLL